MPRQTIIGPLTVQAPSEDDPALIVRDYDGTEHPLPTPGGDSNPVTERVSIAFNTPNLVLTGIPVYDAAVGDLILIGSSGFFFDGADPNSPELWDGTTPQLWVYFATENPHTSCIFDGNPGLLDSGPSNFSAKWTFANAGLKSSNSPQTIKVTVAGTILAMVDDGAGGDPGSSHGAGELVIVIQKAP